MKRRNFIKTGIASTLGAGLTILADPASARTAAANEKINMALIGCGDRSKSLLHGCYYPSNSQTRIKGFQEFDEVNVLYCCDPQSARGEKSAQLAGATYVPDMRTVFDDKNVDAVITALPHHWHALACIRACQAGKDVYAEKPASHSAWEGQKMIEAARKYKKIVQLGTQNRSAPYNIEAKKYLDEGKLGPIHFCRVVNQGAWDNNHFKIGAGVPVPEGFNWDLWLGPAAYRPFCPTIPQRYLQLWDYSVGGIANQGVHQLDLARMLIGKEFPKSAYAIGARFTDPNGDGQTPDTLTATYEYDDMMMVYEQALYTPYMLETDPALRQADMFPYWMQNSTRIELYGTKGLMVVGRMGGGWQVFVRTKDRQPVVTASQYGRYPDVEHRQNFLDCLRSRELPNADIEIGHRSTLLVHYAIISCRSGGEKLEIDQKDGTLLNKPRAEKFWKREYREPFAVPDDV